MKQIVFFLLAACLAVTTILAQPAKIHLQGVLRDSTGSLLNGDFTITVRIFKDSTGGLPIYTSPPSLVRVDNGSFLIKVNADVYDVDNTEQNLSYGQLFFELMVEEEVMLARQPVGFVPFASMSRRTIGLGSIASATGAVAGGTNNRARGVYSFVGGGGGATPTDSNSALADYAIIVGGKNNYVGAGPDNEDFSIIVGGENNAVRSSYSYIGGGRNNFMGAGADNEDFSAIVGGENNTVRSNYSVIVGGRDNLVSGGNSVDVGGNLIVGGRNNLVSGGGSFNVSSSLIVGGRDNLVSGGNSIDLSGSLIVGGMANLVSHSFSGIVTGSYNRARGKFTFVGGGGGSTENDSNSVLADYGVLVGGKANKVSGVYGVIGGGQMNVCDGDHSVVVSGQDNDCDELADQGAILGGLRNMITAPYTFIGGGRDNDCDAMHGSVCGGDSNAVRTDGTHGHCGGGSRNTVRGAYGVIGGGIGNDCDGIKAVVAGGEECDALDDHAVCGGGFRNVASGKQSVVPGGDNNAARGNHSFAAGNRAKANHEGAVVIAASSGVGTGDTVASGGSEQMVLRADGGVYVTNAAATAPYDAAKLINTSSGGYLTTGGMWTNSSDRNKKENFTPVDGKELLEKLSRLPITMWNYKTDSKDVKHIGPVAQDFNEIFGLGSDDKSISTIDPAGIALAAIKELVKKNEELATQNDELALRLAVIEERMKSSLGQNK